MIYLPMHISPLEPHHTPSWPDICIVAAAFAAASSSHRTSARSGCDALLVIALFRDSLKELSANKDAAKVRYSAFLF